MIWSSLKLPLRSRGPVYMWHPIASGQIPCRYWFILFTRVTRDTWRVTSHWAMSLLQTALWSMHLQQRGGAAASLSLQAWQTASTAGTAGTADNTAAGSVSSIVSCLQCHYLQQRPTAERTVTQPHWMLSWQLNWDTIKIYHTVYRLRSFQSFGHPVICHPVICHPVICSSCHSGWMVLDSSIYSTNKEIVKILTSIANDPKY